MLACVSLITLDHQGGADSPVEPARRAVGEVFGPLESGTAAVVRPIAAVPGWFRSHDSLRAELSALEAENAELRSEVATSGYDRNRLEEYDGLTAAAENLGYALVPARVIAVGPSQSFSPHRHHRRRLRRRAARPTRPCSTTTGWSAGCCAHPRPPRPCC